MDLKTKVKNHPHRKQKRFLQTKYSYYLYLLLVYIVHKLFVGLLVSTIPTEACDSFYGNFRDLNVALISCSDDINCICVVDKGCDGIGPFQSCMKLNVGGDGKASKCINSTTKGAGRS